MARSKLDEYYAKRDFSLTPEPKGRVHGTKDTGCSYLIQKHAARRLHYDFRLEFDGVLLSWAVPKGPSLDPRERRLAVRTEDHPLEYGTFEGVIPEGEYGGGTVLLWDRGTWRPVGDANAGLRKGHLTFELDGERLHGRWHLVRSSRAGRSSRGGRGSAPGKQEWLLFKGKDEHARPGSGSEVVDDAPTSVVSGRDLKRIAAQRTRVWSSTEGEVDVAPRLDASGVKGARRAKDVGTPSPALARLADQVPDGDEWLHELKLDGYRVLAHLEDGEVRLITRAGKDWTKRFPAVADALRELPASRALLDGEVVIVLPDGRTSFQALQNALSNDPRPRGELAYYVFDLLHLDGFDLRGAPLVERKRLLRALLEGGPAALRFSAHVRGNGDEFFVRACQHGVEGVVSKRADAPYRPGRGLEWLKIKCLARQELVIGGFTEPSGSRSGLGALLLGYHDGDGGLRYAGKVGTGFTAASLRDLYRRLRPLERETSPFADRIPRMRTRVHWVEPRLVGEVDFTEWTDEGVLRHPSFQGLREDKDPRTVVRETTSPPPAVRSSTSAPAAAPKPPVTTEGRVRTVRDTIEVAGVVVSSPEKVLWPDAEITKRELAEYHAAIADWSLPRLARRPLSLVRCPGGCAAKCFYQKHGNKTVHASIPRIDVMQEGEPYVFVEDLNQLMRLVQLNVIEFHVWGSRAPDYLHADMIVMDLDPDEGLPFARVVEAAFAVKERLAELGLPAFCKTTGGKGLHVVTPIAPTLGWDEVKQFTKALSEEFARRQPDKYTSKITKVSRKGRVFVDYLRNQFDATAIGAYSPRARKGGTVSVPLFWDEVVPTLDPSQLTLRTVPQRLRQLRADPWADFDAARVPITDAMKAAVGFGDTRMPRPRARGRGHG
jgi:bifunctional non-homologous end joining protein LigD